MKTVEICCSKTCVNFGRCYGNKGWAETVGGAVANRLRRRTLDQTVLGSNPAVAAVLSPWTRLYTPFVPRRSLHISFC